MNTIKIIKGYYSLEQARLLEYVQPPDKSRRVDVWRLEEKQTDVTCLRLTLEFRYIVGNTATTLSALFEGNAQPWWLFYARLFFAARAGGRRC